jgi:signal transduction histidine kinase
LLLITIPTLTAVVLGGTRIVTSVQQALTYQRIETLANLSSAVTSLAGRLEDERDQTVIYIAQGAAGRAGELNGHKANAAAQLELVSQQYKFTKPWVDQVQGQLSHIGSGYPAQVQQDAASIKSVLQGLANLRTASVGTFLPALIVVSKYTSAIDSLLAIDDDIALDSGDPVLASSVRELGVISRIEEGTSQQRAILAYAFTQEHFGPGVLSALTTAQAEMNDNISEFDNSASPQQTSLYQNTVSGSLVDLADQYEQQAIAFGTSDNPLSDSATTAEEWFGAMSGKIGAMRTVEQKLVSAAVTRASDLRRTAIIDSIAIGAAIIVVLGLALVFTTLVGRSMVRPLRRLRAGALEVAGLQLPETVRRMSESDGSGVPLTVAPIDVDSTDEIGEVARAFDQVHREALRLAANEAALRGNVNAMFVNLSRRSQSLVERQIRLIDDLEQGEQDAERLGSLFQMDHLATRMRRNSENLLVLAGHDSSRRWNQPVALVDVLRAAVSEIEQYERVSLNVQPGISVRGHAVNDAVHLLAELAENATSFSSAETPVTISGHLLSSGGVLLDITDQGVGMGAEEMAHANWRLDNPPVVDVAVSRRMGLFVVARLAARHGIRVRLRPAASGGLTALVWLPDEVVSREGSGSAPGSRMPDLPIDAASMTMPGIGDGNGSQWTDERAATAEQVNAARTPKFASTQGNAGENGTLSPRRVPGSGPRPGASQWTPAATGPLPAFRTSPQPAGEPDADAAEPFATAPQQAIRGDAGRGGMQPGGGPTISELPSSGLASTGPAATELASSGFAGTGSRPTGDRESSSGWPEAPSQELPATSQPPASKPAAGGSQKLPKRQVDRPESGGNGATDRAAGTDLFSREPARGSSHDMFSPNPGRASGGNLFSASPRPASTPESAEPVQPPERPERSEPRQPAETAADTGALPVFNAPISSEAAPSGASNGYTWDTSPVGDSVVVPSADHATEYRLPIFEAVESDWFRRGRSSVGWAPQEPEAEPEKSNWTSPADEGWQAAAAVAAPSSSGVTSAGLPKRVPKANLVPGTAESSAPAPAAPVRSAAVTRDRFASFQRGVREGRAAAVDDGSAGEDDGSR